MVLQGVVAPILYASVSHTEGIDFVTLKQQISNIERAAKAYAKEHSGLQLAEKSKVPQACISPWLRGLQAMSISNLIKLEKFLAKVNQ